MRFIRILLLLCLLSSNLCFLQNVKPNEFNKKWSNNLWELAPKKSKVTPKKERKVLIFSLFTGYRHWSIPHTSEMIKVLGTKTGAYETQETKNINVFKKALSLNNTTIVLNNTCPNFNSRNLFYDELKKTYKNKKALRKAKKLELKLLNFVKKGGGLVVLHGGITMLNKSSEFSKMVGASFDYHPPQQNITVNIHEPKHTIVSHFKGESFVIIDEPYFLKNAYFDYNFRPLLSMNPKFLHSVKKNTSKEIKYISWIKSYGKGRIFFSAPSHNSQTYENANFLKFILNGIQYAAGDLTFNDSVINTK